MSWWGGAQQAKLDIAAMEAEYSIMNDLFQKVNNTCREKCVPPQYVEGDVTKGEAVCIDRCVAKYFAVSQSVAKLMREKQPAM